MDFVAGCVGTGAWFLICCKWSSIDDRRHKFQSKLLRCRIAIVLWMSDIDAIVPLVVAASYFDRVQLRALISSIVSCWLCQDLVASVGWDVEHKLCHGPL